MNYNGLAISALLAIASAQPPQVIKVPVRLVSVPTVVVDAKQDAVQGLQADDFQLTDNGILQTVQLDDAYQPLSVVFAVQASEAVRSSLPIVKRLASTVEALLLGEEGEAAVVRFSDEIDVVQPLTRDWRRVDRGFAVLGLGGAGARVVDALGQCATLLQHVPSERRRIIILISQDGDIDSQGAARGVLRRLASSGITVYAIILPKPRGKQVMDSISVQAGPVTLGGRTGSSLTIGIDLTTALHGVLQPEGADKQYTVTSFVDSIGGRSLDGENQSSIEKAVARIGEEIRGGYSLTYRPTEMSAGFHRIQVRVRIQGLAVRARAGYYVGPKEDP
jgi:VWFA-related protein